MSNKSPGLPPGGSNCDDAAAQINARAQRQEFVARTSNTVMTCESGPLTLRGQSAMMMDATVIEAVGLAGSRRIANPVLGQPDLVVHSSEDARAPYRVLEFFLLLLGSKYDLAHFGDIDEQFDSECARFGRARANWRYWAKALGILLSALARAAIKLAVIITALKRYFS